MGHIDESSNLNDIVYMDVLMVRGPPLLFDSIQALIEEEIGNLIKTCRAINSNK